MIPVDQLVLSGDDSIGDCVRACVASIFEMRCEDVPHFAEEKGTNWKAGLTEWLAREHGCSLVRVSEDGLDSARMSVFNGWFMGIGVSPRSNGKDGLHHAVVFEGSGSGNWKMAHDPHPSRDGVKSVTAAYLFIKTV